MIRQCNTLHVIFGIILISSHFFKQKMEIFGFLLLEWRPNRREPTSRITQYHLARLLTNKPRLMCAPGFFKSGSLRILYQIFLILFSTILCLTRRVLGCHLGEAKTLRRELKFSRFISSFGMLLLLVFTVM